MEQAFKDRLALLLENDGRSISKFASAVGLTDSAFRNYFDGAMPNLKKAIEIAREGKVNLEWLATGHGPSGITFDNIRSIKDDAHIIRGEMPRSYIGIPLLDMTASAGDGRAVLDERQTGFVHFEESWLRSTYHINPAELFSLPVIGESMEPTIKAGEFLLVSTNEIHARPGDGIYVIRVDGNILVKRLQVMPGKIKVSSDNATMYQSYDVDLSKAGDFAVLGKVLLVHGLRRI